MKAFVTLITMTLGMFGAFSVLIYFVTNGASARPENKAALIANNKPAYFTYADFEQIEKGMSYQDVRDTFGKPVVLQRREESKRILAKWSNRKKESIEVLFENGQVIKKHTSIIDPNETAEEKAARLAAEEEKQKEKALAIARKNKERHSKAKTKSVARRSLISEVDARVAVWDAFDKRFKYGYKIDAWTTSVENVGAYRYVFNDYVKINNAYGATRRSKVYIEVEMESRDLYHVNDLRIQ